MIDKHLILIFVVRANNVLLLKGPLSNKYCIPIYNILWIVFRKISNKREVN